MSHSSFNTPPQKPQTDFLAHVRRNEDGSFEIHHLEEHLRAVADLVGEFALSIGCSV